VGWGFTVYSTYPPSASEAFDQSICERFQAYIEFNLRFTVDEPFGETIPLNIEYIRFPFASILDARTYFRAKHGWPGKYETSILRNHEHHDMRHGIFVVIDEETMKTWGEAPGPVLEIPTRSRRLTAIEKEDEYPASAEKEDDIVIKVIKVDYDEECDGVVFSTASRAKDSPYSTVFMDI
jgi:hypothetical protein